jgi:polyhydroxybutyrate depolymerase
MGRSGALARITLAVLGSGLIATACSSTSSSGPAAVVSTAADGLPPAPSTGCSSSAPAELTLAKEYLTVDGEQRWYLESTPPRTRKGPFPVVLDFHGLDEGAGLEALTSQFGPFAQRHGFIAVFPEGTGKPLGWDYNHEGSSNPDLAYVTALLNRLEATQCVDETRIYSTGLSEGAFMTSLLACTMSNRIAAFAPVSGVLLEAPCAAKHPVPILAFHGTADPILYFNGGFGSAVLKNVINLSGPPPSVPIPPANLNGKGYPATVAAWAKRDGCAAKATNTQVSPHVIHRVYRCPPGTAVEFYIIIGGGHAWPSSAFSQEIAAITGPTTFEINATTVIWKFFQRFQLRR